MKRLYFLVPIAFAAAACSLPDLPVLTDGGSDDVTASDTGTNETEAAVEDGGNSIGRDATTDAGHVDSGRVVDSGQGAEAGRDAGPEASVDAGTGDVGIAGFACSSADAHACAGNAQKQVLTCTGGVWTVTSTCPSGQNCDSSPGATQAACVTIVPACASATPGSSVCSTAAAAVKCGPDLVSDSPVATCTNQACVAGTCAGQCTPGATQCSGNGVQTCGTSGIWGDAVDCSNSTCAMGACTGSCSAGSKQCSGNAAVESCVAGMWGAPAACTNQACVSGACTGQCSPGATQCSSNGVESCSTSGVWIAAAACTNKTCVSGPGTGACTGVCAPGQTNPVACGNCGTDTQTCTTGGAWQSNTCAGQGACAANATEACNTYGTQSCSTSCAWLTCTCASAPACTPAATKCSSGTAQETCSACGQWGSAVTCTTSVAHATGACTNNACGGFACTSGYNACGGSCANLESDGANCGACGHSCQGGTCTSGTCNPVALGTVSSSVTVANFAVNSTAVYFATAGANAGGGGLIEECPLSGCSSGPSVIGQGIPSTTFGFTANSTGVYWIGDDGSVDGVGYILGCPGGNCSTITTYVTYPSLVNLVPLDIVGDATNIYWTLVNNQGTLTSTVVSCPIGGCPSGGPTTLYSQAGGSSGASVNFIGAPAPSSGAGPVYFASNAGGDAFMTRCPGGSCPLPDQLNEEVFSSTVNSYWWQAIKADSSNVYWLDTQNDNVLECSVNGCASGPTVLASSQNFAENYNDYNGAYKLGLDATNVYWTVGTNIEKCAITGCNKSPSVVPGISGQLIGVDSTCIYYFASGGVISKLAK